PPGPPPRPRPCGAPRSGTTPASPSSGSGSRSRERGPMGDHDVAVLGVGMHPWGKWGRNFVEYGLVAARAALEDAGLEWGDIQFVSGADTIRNGYPGFVWGA